MAAKRGVETGAFFCGKGLDEGQQRRSVYCTGFCSAGLRRLPQIVSGNDGCGEGFESCRGYCKSFATNDLRLHEIIAGYFLLHGPGHCIARPTFDATTRRLCNNTGHFSEALAAILAPSARLLPSWISRNGVDTMAEPQSSHADG